MAEKFKFLEFAAQTARLMVGIPDYGNYVRHRETHHPGEPVMTYEQFYENRLQARYGKGKMQRCC
jgi:uncharacterized short protein YbdD (DUF466 family)